MFKAVKNFFKDQRGALTTVEIIGYTVLIGGAVALIGFGITSLGRGKLGDAINAVDDTQAMDDLITDTSGYGYSAVAGDTVKDADTGIVTHVKVN
ncbi:MAG: hypothetical protein ACYC2T_08370 [Bacillota bacterium]